MPILDILQNEEITWQGEYDGQKIVMTAHHVIWLGPVQPPPESKGTKEKCCEYWQVLTARHPQEGAVYKICDDHFREMIIPQPAEAEKCCPRASLGNGHSDGCYVHDKPTVEKQEDEVEAKINDTMDYYDISDSEICRKMLNELVALARSSKKQ